MNNHKIWPHFGRTQNPFYQETLFQRGQGAYLFDNRGKKYFDSFSTLWTNLVGHGRPEIIDAISRQATKLSFMHLFGGALHESAIELADRLIQLCGPERYGKVFFGTSGSDATETAIKMARAYWHIQGKPQKKTIVGRQNTYHGTSLGALALMGWESYQEPFQPLAGGIQKIPAPYCAACHLGKQPDQCATECKTDLRRYFESIRAKETVAAFLVEPVITSDGLITSRHEYWKEVVKTCREFDVLIIADEVSSGMGRTGTFLASSQLGIDPDIVYLAKSLTSGYAPLSATIASQKVAEPFFKPEQFFAHGTTFGGHPLACTAALQVLDILEKEKLAEKALAPTHSLDSLLKSYTNEPAILRHNAFGWLAEVEIDPKAIAERGFESETHFGLALYRSLLENGIYSRCLGRFVCIAPPLISTPEEIREMCSTIASTVGSVRPG